MADQLVTPAELASHLQQDLDTATATLLIEEATGAVQAAVGQRLVQVVDDPMTLEGNHEQYLVLPERPVTAVSSVTIDGLTVIDYRPYLRRARLWRYWGWRGVTITTATFLAPYSAVVVTNTHGYAAGDQKLQPARAVVFALCAQAYANPAGATLMAIDDYREAYGGGQGSSHMTLSDQQRAALRRAYGTAVGSARLVRQ